MKFHLNRNIDIRETGLVLQPKLFRLASSSDGLVSDRSNEDVRQIGLMGIKCPKSKQNSKINDLVHDQSFYVKYEDGVPVLKKDHPNFTLCMAHLACMRIDATDWPSLSSAAVN